MLGRCVRLYGTWRRPTLPRLETQYHGRGGFSRPSSGWDRVLGPSLWPPGRIKPGWGDWSGYGGVGFLSDRVGTGGLAPGVLPARWAVSAQAPLGCPRLRCGRPLALPSGSFGLVGTGRLAPAVDPLKRRWAILAALRAAVGLAFGVLRTRRIGFSGSGYLFPVVAWRGGPVFRFLAPGAWCLFPGTWFPFSVACEEELRVLVGSEIKPIERLVPVSCMRCRTWTSGLSTWWSTTALKGDLVLRGASRLDAFSGYPVRT